jgi:hypothetical protein
MGTMMVLTSDNNYGVNGWKKKQWFFCRKSEPIRTNNLIFLIKLFPIKESSQVHIGTEEKNEMNVSFNKRKVGFLSIKNFDRWNIFVKHGHFTLFFFLGHD